MYAKEAASNIQVGEEEVTATVSASFKLRWTNLFFIFLLFLF
jgi:hypothetical protein